MKQERVTWSTWLLVVAAVVLVGLALRAEVASASGCGQDLLCQANERADRVHARKDEERAERRVVREALEDSRQFGTGTKVWKIREWRVHLDDLGREDAELDAAIEAQLAENEAMAKKCAWDRTSWCMQQAERQLEMERMADEAWERTVASQEAGLKRIFGDRVEMDLNEPAGRRGTEGSGGRNGR